MLQLFTSLFLLSLNLFQHEGESSVATGLPGFLVPLFLVILMLLLFWWGLTRPSVGKNSEDDHAEESDQGHGETEAEAKPEPEQNIEPGSK